MLSLVGSTKNHPDQIIDMLGKEEQEKATRQKCCFEEEEMKQKQDPANMENESEEDGYNALTEN
eukprot:1750353-Ditylum_brightwellii.AAC.1